MAIELFAAVIHQAGAGVEHESVVARIQIGAADEHDAIEQFQDAIQIILFGVRREDDRDSTYGSDAIVIAGRHEGEGWRIFLGGAIVCIQTNQRLLAHRTSSLDTSCVCNKVEMAQSYTAPARRHKE